MSKSGKGCYPHNDIYMYLTGTLNGSNYDDFKQLSMSRQSTNWGFIKFIMKIPYLPSPISLTSFISCICWHAWFFKINWDDVRLLITHKFFLMNIGILWKKKLNTVTWILKKRIINSLWRNTKGVFGIEVL